MTKHKQALPLKVIKLLRKFNLDSYKVIPLVGDASDRRYFRLKKGKTSQILMDYSKTIPNMETFLAVRNYLSAEKLSVPEIFRTDLYNKFAILEDLGNETLDRYLIKNPEKREEVYNVAIDLLTFLNTKENPPFPRFDRQFFFSELSAFTSGYIPFIGKTLNEKSLTKFNYCWNEPLNYLSMNDKKMVFVHKDLHCGNLFWLPEREGLRKLGIIDFQSAKSGSFVYDITSLLYDCRLPLEIYLRNNLLKKYLAKQRSYTKEALNLCDIYIAQRNIKILGNFANIYIKKGNSEYLKFLPNVFEFINESLKNPILENLKKWFDENEISLS